jgi:hypothetical protein
VENASVNFYLDIACEHLDWQVSSMAQIFKVLCPLFSDVIDLALDYREHTLSSEWHNQADPIIWRELLGSFTGVKHFVFTRVLLPNSLVLYDWTENHLWRSYLS